MFSSDSKSSGVNKFVFIRFRDQNWNRDISVNWDFMSDWDSNSNVGIYRNSVLNLVVSVNDVSSVNRSVIAWYSSSVNWSSLLQLNISLNGVLSRLSDLSGVYGSSWNIVVHSSLGLSGLNRKIYNLFWMSDSRRVNKPKFGLLGVVDRLNVVLSVNSVTRDGNLSDSGVILVDNIFHSWFSGSSNVRRIDKLYGFSVVSKSRLNVLIVSGNWSSNLHVS